MNTPDDITADTLVYFAYGSNMCTAWLKSRVPSATRLRIARVPGYELKFHKRSTDGSGKGNIIASPGAEVIGALFTIRASEKPELDKAEGLPES